MKELLAHRSVSWFFFFFVLSFFTRWLLYVPQIAKMICFTVWLNPRLLVTHYHLIYPLFGKYYLSYQYLRETIEAQSNVPTVEGKKRHYTCQHFPQLVYEHSYLLGKLASSLDTNPIVWFANKDLMKIESVSSFISLN